MCVCGCTSEILYGDVGRVMEIYCLLMGCEEQRSDVLCTALCVGEEV